MKTAETPVTPRSTPGHPLDAPLRHTALVVGRGHSKILAQHCAKLAVVYVRQSSLQQVWDNRESTARQYALHDYAVALGWPATRVLTIDEDQGQSGASAQGRPGFQRLLAEVTMNHVGLVLGLEMSRLARSSKDWHHLLEVCALFGTLLADQDGVYDASDPNDRLLLGLKGTMSEVELHTMRQRLERGRLHKAHRGAMFHGVPMGYVLLATDEVAKDPDVQARAVIELLFDQFDHLGSLYGLFHYLVRQHIWLPIRARTGPQKGQLQWRRPSLATLAQVLHHPIYAGAYAYGRRPVGPPRVYAGRPAHSRKWVPLDQWAVLIQDRLPAYITWEHYLRNQARLKQNQSAPDTMGAPREGVALLAGIVVCGMCGRRMHVSYRRTNQPYYACLRHFVEATEPRCPGIQATVLDTCVAQHVLRALEPAALELSRQARHDVERERAQLDQHWQHQVQRARYEVDLAERRYQAVDPANRLVAATLEQRWEEALRQARQLQEAYERFLRETPPDLQAEEWAQITAMAADIPALWQAVGTTNRDRQAMVRCLVHHVVVHIQRASEYVQVAIEWTGGALSHHEVIRPVRTYAQRRDVDSLMRRIRALRTGGATTAQIATALNTEGFVPPKRYRPFSKELICQLLERQGLGDERRVPALLGPDEWWLGDLARTLSMSPMKLREWVVRGWLHARKSPAQGLWIVWADPEEQARLGQLLTQSHRGANAYPASCTTPKPRPPAPASERS
jgi:DNA invertase Pin-like site-specific DNA recombinase